MIDVKAAARAIEVLKNSNLSFPPEDTAIKLLAKMIGKHAVSEPHAKAVIEKWIETQASWPTPANLVDMCLNIPDPAAAVARATREGCQRCGGSGYISVDGPHGPHGTSAAYPCSHGPATEVERRMGVRINPALARHYSQLEIEAEERAARWVGSGGRPVALTVTKIMEGV